MYHTIFTPHHLVYFIGRSPHAIKIIKEARKVVSLGETTTCACRFNIHLTIYYMLKEIFAVKRVASLASSLHHYTLEDNYGMRCVSELT